MLVAILMSALIGVAAIAVDLSRLYVVREQLRAAADAGALAGAVDLSHQRLDSLVGTATSYALANSVGGAGSAVSSEDVQVGVWDFDSRSFTPVARADWNSVPVNAIRVTARHPMSLTFGRIFDMAERQLVVSATAAVGYVSGGTCVKPWALAYADLVGALPGGRGGGVLSPEDVSAIARADAGASRSPSLAIGAVDLLDLGGGYASSISGCSGRHIRAGDVIHGYVAPETSVQRDTRTALWQLCDANGGASGSSESGSFYCPGEPKVEVVLWGSREERVTESGRSVTYRVQYVGVIRVVGYGGTPARVRGYFSTMASPGVFETAATPLTRVALVR